VKSPSNVTPTYSGFQPLHTVLSQKSRSGLTSIGQSGHDGAANTAVKSSATIGPDIVAMAP